MSIHSGFAAQAAIGNVAISPTRWSSGRRREKGGSFTLVGARINFRQLFDRAGRPFFDGGQASFVRGRLIFFSGRAEGQRSVGVTVLHSIRALNAFKPQQAT